MFRKSLKILSLFTVIILIQGPLVTSQTKTLANHQIDNKNLKKLFTDEKIQEIINKINETLVKTFMEYLIFEIGSRSTGSYGCQKAGKYIYNQFENMGLQVRFQNWSDSSDQWHPIITSQNIEATQQGLNPNWDDVIIFNAHYDTLMGTVGANDDGSGTVSVLAAAYVLSQYNFKRTIKFVTFSGEEQGLLGSQVYAKELYDQQTPVLVEFNADGIGKATTAENGRKIWLTITEDTRWITGIMKNVTKNYGLNFNITTVWNMNRDLPIGISDYFSFIRLGYESICVWPAEGDQNYHTPKDNISNINLSYLVNTTRHIAATMAILADMDIEQPQIYIANPRYGKIFYSDRPQKSYKYNIPIIIDKTNIYAEVKPGLYTIDRVEFYYGNKLLFMDKEKPYEYLLNKRSIGLHKITVIVYDTKGNTATDQIKILFLNIKKK